MENQIITFDNLPRAISQMLIKLESIEHRLDAVLPTKLNQQVSELLNVQQAADLMGVAVQTVYGYVTRREIPHIKRKKRLLFDRDELMAWMREGKRLTSDELETEAKAEVDKLVSNANRTKRKG
jgi:excisionase family DNA binding protein